jgi:Cd2+/Zn2+-exporting ATPase
VDLSFGLASRSRFRHLFEGFFSVFFSVFFIVFLFGVFFIIGGLAAAAMGYLNPIVAAIMHNAGSLIVVFNSARLVRMGEELEPFHAPTQADAGSASTPSTGRTAPKPSLVPA